jgi:hypothetical protein
LKKNSLCFGSKLIIDFSSQKMDAKQIVNEIKAEEHQPEFTDVSGFAGMSGMNCVDLSEKLFHYAYLHIKFLEATQSDELQDAKFHQFVKKIANKNDNQEFEDAEVCKRKRSKQNKKRKKR